jgi:ATP-dependent DNA helicase RecG
VATEDEMSEGVPRAPRAANHKPMTKRNIIIKDSKINMKRNELQLIIKEGEGLTVEFKEKYTPKIDRDIVAFANTKGGLLLLGINDKGKVIGEKLTNQIKAEINSIARNCDPKIYIKNAKQVGNIVVIEITEGDEKPYCSSSGYYRRLDAVTQKMAQKEVRVLFRETDVISFESLYCRDLKIQKISLSKVKIFLKETGVLVKTSKANLFPILSSLGVVDKNKITKAGALMFALNVEKHIPHAEIIMGAFKGKDRTHIFDRKDIRDDLFTQFNEAVAFLMKHLNIRSEIRGVDRHDIYEIPIDALREAVVNAIVHRDYAFKGTSIYVSIFDDRVEIENPGGLPSGLTVKNLGQSSIRRNPIIADLFHRMGKVERMGSGIDRMRNLMRESGLKTPVFETDNFFRVIFYRDPRYSLKGGQKGWSERVVRKDAQKLTLKQRSLVILLKHNPAISRKDISNKIGINESAVQKRLNTLKKKGILRRIGPDRGGHWKTN